MNWKKKAMVQRVCARLPFAKEPMYYYLQRFFGNLRELPDPWWYLDWTSRFAESLHQAGHHIAGARVMEVGSGHGLQIPLGFFLCGAESIATYDLHRYLKDWIVSGTVQKLLADRQRVFRVLGEVADAKDVGRRLQLLSECHGVTELFRTAKIHYLAPADASKTTSPDQSIDIHISNNVLEHISPVALKAILLEAARVLKSTGVALHLVCPSDHFSDDRSILPINFLQFPDEEWDRLADNPFAYHNRLRASDYQKLFEESGHEILNWKPSIDPDSLTAIQAGFPIAPRFHGKSVEDLCTILIQALSRPNTQVQAAAD